MIKIFQVGLLIILGAIASCSTKTNASSPDTFETFADWCNNKRSLNPEAKKTVNALLSKVETKNCKAAEEKLTSMTTLSLPSQQLRDISPLSSLKNLKSLDLASNPVEDISPLKKLTNLKILSLNSEPEFKGGFSDISHLANLTNLEFLSLGYTPIKDLSPLESLIKLKDLTLVRTQIEDVTPLQNLTRLEYLNLNANPIKDISPLASLTKLQDLRVAGTDLDKKNCPLPNKKACHFSYPSEDKNL